MKCFVATATYHSHTYAEAVTCVLSHNTLQWTSRINTICINGWSGDLIEWSSTGVVVETHVQGAESDWNWEKQDLCISRLNWLIELNAVLFVDAHCPAVTSRCSSRRRDSQNTRTPAERQTACWDTRAAMWLKETGRNGKKWLGNDYKNAINRTGYRALFG